MTTMKEIAERTGVSVSTVSLVLNGRDAGRVKPGIASKVRKTAEDLGYRPNPLARSLRTSKTKILGFISDEIATTPYAGRLILGAQDAARSMGYMLLTVNTNGDVELERHEISTLKQYDVDGFLYACMFDRAVDPPDSLEPLPTVLLDGTDKRGRLASIVPDEHRIGYDATRRLIEAGCRSIAYIGAGGEDLPKVSGQVIADRYPADVLREQGYLDALHEAGRETDPDLMIRVSFNRPALDAVSDLFDRKRPDGFVCFNDARAWYVYLCAAQRGLTIGRDVSVVGVDNHRLVSDTLAPELTTVDLPHYEMGYWGTLKLVSIIEHRTPDDAALPGTRSPLPDLSETNAMIHCTLLERHSVTDPAR
ncbi:LacI family DNA-binding transcriptional regulator [Bifidobacterium simiarum]|uniref:LacI family DNA-binding transcriptional regulator n=1 Tax=Bifidobacterium simiarum TaxID=2045441 RepID=UPI001BDCA41B|nr:LacI family DNA-binding transcriptional regulator [Bifidobacterium simiarum]MBT1165346.1 LacI family DNA-binding transcriptional regulator [Bifidobacterium simiarum]